MSDVKWIKITTNMFDDEKIRLIESMPDADAVLVIWVKLLVQTGRTNANGYIFLNENIPYTDEMLATIFNRPLNTVRLALQTFKRFGMIEMDENGIRVINWDKHQNIEGLEKIREQTRQRVAKHREQKKLQEGNKDVTLPVTLSNAPELELDLDKKEKEHTEQFFETIWKLYPRRKGKAGVKETQRKRLMKVGEEQLRKCIERFKRDMEQEKRPLDKYPYGSTFFNGGYIDYLDENYTEKVEHPTGIRMEVIR